MLQVVDSEYDVYIPQTSKEIEYALTIQKTQAELIRYKNENLSLKEMNSKLEKERESIQRMADENADTLKRQAEEISQLRGRLEMIENVRENTCHQIVRSVETEIHRQNAKTHETQRKTVAQTSTATPNVGETMSGQHENCHRLEEIKMLINGQECMQNSRLPCDIQHFDEKQANAWSTFLEILSKNIKLPKDMH